MKYYDSIGNPINYDIEESKIKEAKTPLAKIVRSDYTREMPPLEPDDHHLKIAPQPIMVHPDGTFQNRPNQGAKTRVQ